MFNLLIEHTLFGSVDKVQIAIDLLKKYEPPEGYYLCFSGGKDSTVIYDLAIKAGVKFDAHHNITTVEPPQLMRFIRDHYPDIVNEHPKKSMFQLIVERKIPPLRMARYCCAELKEIHGKDRFKLTGIRSEESPRRAKRPQLDKHNNGKSFFLHIIKDWSEQDVWQYIRENNLPYCNLYDLGFKRIGCVLCPFQNYEQTQRDLELFPAIADYYRRACRKSYEVHKSLLKKWQSGDDIFDWWINTRKGRYIAQDCNQIPLFSEDDGSIL